MVLVVSILEKVDCVITKHIPVIMYYGISNLYVCMFKIFEENISANYWPFVREIHQSQVEEFPCRNIIILLQTAQYYYLSENNAF